MRFTDGQRNMQQWHWICLGLYAQSLSVSCMKCTSSKRVIFYFCLCHCRFIRPIQPRCKMQSRRQFRHRCLSSQWASATQKKSFNFFSRVTFKTDQHKQLAYVFFFCKQQWTTSWAIGRSMACQCSQQTECFNFHFGIYSFFHPTAVCRFRSFHHGMHQNMFRVGHAFMTINKNIGRKTWFNLVIVGFFS